MPFTIRHIRRLRSPRAVTTNGGLFKGIGVLCLIGVLSLLLVSCSHVVFPVTSGSHAPAQPGRPPARQAVVWSNHPSAGKHLTALAQQVGLVVVEHARVQQLLDEHKIRFTHGSDNDAHILRVGKLIGADRVIFVQVREKSIVGSQSYVNSYYGGASSETVYHVSVMVRGVDVETGAIRWSGTARVPQIITNPEEAVGILVKVAAARALCPVESGYQWKERTGQNQDAECMKDGKQVDLIEHKHAILPLL